MLVEGLPPDNAVVRARNDGRESWHDSQYLLHQIESRLRELQAAVANLGGAKVAAEDITYLPTPEAESEDDTPLVTEQQINEMDALQDRMFGGN